MHINKLTTSPPSVLSTALFKMSSSDSDSHSNASQGDDSHARLLESIARCPQAIKNLSDALMPALINNLEHIAERNQAWLRSEEPRAHREGRSASTSGEQVSLNASDGGDPGGDVGGSAISSLNGPGSGSGADGRSGSGMEASQQVRAMKPEIQQLAMKPGVQYLAMKPGIQGLAMKPGVQYLAMKPGIQYVAMKPLEGLAVRPWTQHCQCISPHPPMGSQFGFPATRQGTTKVPKPRIFPHMDSRGSSLTQAFGRAANA